MNVVDLLPILNPMQEQVSKVFTVFSGVIIIVLALWFLNFIFSLIQRIYSIGKAIGSFYRAYLHKYLKALFVSLLSIFPERNSQSLKL